MTDTTEHWADPSTAPPFGEVSPLPLESEEPNRILKLCKQRGWELIDLALQCTKHESVTPESPYEGAITNCEILEAWARYTAAAVQSLEDPTSNDLDYAVHPHVWVVITHVLETTSDYLFGVTNEPRSITREEVAETCAAVEDASREMASMQEQIRVAYEALEGLRSVRRMETTALPRPTNAQLEEVLHKYLEEWWAADAPRVGSPANTKLVLDTVDKLVLLGVPVLKPAEEKKLVPPLSDKQLADAMHEFLETVRREGSPAKDSPLFLQLARATVEELVDVLLQDVEVGPRVSEGTL